MLVPARSRSTSSLHPSFLSSLRTNMTTARKSRVVSVTFLELLRSGARVRGRDIRRARLVAIAIAYNGPLLRGDHGQ